MHIKNYLSIFTAFICFYSFQSCKKSSVPDPGPVVKPDTLSTGWTKKIISNENQLADIFFNSATTGYMAGSKGYKSTDGGNNWVEVNTGNNMNNISMTADNKAFLVGLTSTIFKTLDGGSSFTSTNIGARPTDIFFSDNNNGFCIAYDGFYNTIDGGLTWQKITTSGLTITGSGYSSLSFINNTTGWVVTQEGIYRSLGSLTNWQKATVNGGYPSLNFASVYASSATIVYVGSLSGEIFKSTDGGVSFTYIKTLEDQLFTDIHFLNNLVGYACSGRHVFKTTDGGVNWSKEVSLGEGSLIELHFTDANHGWACGNNTVLIFKQ